MPSIRIVIAEQQRAEPRPGAFGIGPTAHHEFLAVQAFDFDPQAAVAGRVSRIGAFRDDPLERHRTGLVMESAAVSSLVVAATVEITKRVREVAVARRVHSWLLCRPDTRERNHLLDEATSALDEKLEAEIYCMLSEVLPNTTIVSIGHRSTLIVLHRRHIEMEPGQGGIFEPTPTMEVGSSAGAQP